MTLKRVVYEPGNLHIHTEIVRKDNVDLCRYSGQKVTDVLRENPTFKVMLLDSAISEIREAEEAQFIGPWKEITRERYEEMLEVLPPEKWQHVTGIAIFRMCEYMTSNITAHYASGGSKYYTAYRRTTWDYADIVKELEDI